MRILNKWAAGICILALMLAGTALMAQSRMEAEIPFDFVLRNTTFDTGHYDLDVRLIGHFMVLKGEGNTNIALIRPSHKQGTSDEAKLVFTRYDDLYFLSEIWMPGTTGLTVRKCAQERFLVTTSQRFHKVTINLHPAGTFRAGGK